MWRTITPEEAGISSALVKKFISKLEQRGLTMHSVLMMRGNDIFAECYWKPFDKNFIHRMYSQTKSFVGVAIGILEQEGKLSLDDKISDYFPERIDRELPEHLKNLTIKDMLTMETAGEAPFWLFHEEAEDRVRWYFNKNNSTHPGGTIWKYDSDGSQVLSVLVEKLSGMTLFEFLKARIFDKLGTFTTAYALKVRNEDSFGDSSMMCTTRDIASFARFVMNYGSWNGERIVNEEYMRKATSAVVDNNISGFEGYTSDGYGYQIWGAENGSFAFHGMGGQFTICVPEKDFIFTCTADNQGLNWSGALLFTYVFDLLVENLENKPLEKDDKSYKELLSYSETLTLRSQRGKTYVPFADIINGKTYICEENKMGITKFSLNFLNESEGEFHYTNEQGDKVLCFGIGKNVFCKFPQYGYSDLHAGLKTTDGFLYDCATSAAWTEDKKLLMNIKIIDKYFGNISIIFSFKENLATVDMVKHAEAFLEEYNGKMVAKAE